MDDNTAVNSVEVEDTNTIAEPTASTEAGAEQTTLSNPDSSAEKLNTSNEGIEGEGADNPLVGKTVPYSRFSEVYSENKELKEKLSQVQPVQSAPVDSSEVQVKGALEKLGYIDRNSVQQMVKDAIAEDRVYREMDTKVQQLSKEWDGKDGRPAFDIEEVADYAQKTGIYDPEAAFKQMNAQSLAEYYAKQARTTVKTERQGKPVQNVGTDYNALREEAIKSGDFSKLIKMKMNS